jgi:hypothetical protein
MRIFLSLFLALLIGGCSSLKVATDYDPDADISAPKSFAIVHKTLEGEDTLTADRIIAALQNELKAKGYTETTQESADFYILFHTGVTSKTRIDTDYQYVNMYPYSYGYGYQTIAIPQTRTYTYDEGKLIVDAVVPQKNKIIWRGTAVDYLKSMKTPQEKTNYINKVLKALMQKFPK